MDILLGADMIHLFPKLDYTVEKLSLYMSFLTKRYIVMGQLPDNAPEEQLAVIRQFTEENSGRRLHLITLPRLGSTPAQLPRRQASLRTTPGGPNRREATSINSAVSGTKLEPATITQPVPTATFGPAAPPTVQTCL